MLNIEYAVESKRLLDGDWDRVDDGRGWSSRNGRGYSLDEATEEALSITEDVRHRSPGYSTSVARVVQRGVTGWEPVPTGPEPFTTDEPMTDEERVLYILRASLHHLPNEAAQRHIAQSIIAALREQE